MLLACWSVVSLPTIVCLQLEFEKHSKLGNLLLADLKEELGLRGLVCPVGHRCHCHSVILAPLRCDILIACTCPILPSS
jgi:hypothetical protein